MNGEPDTSTIVRAVAAVDVEAITRIYNHYVAESVATFDEEPLALDGMARRIDEVHATDFPWLVADQDGAVAGFAYGGRWKTRRSYRYSAEVTVYLDAGCAGRGIGSLLYDRLIAMLIAKGVHVLIAGISLPNESSVALHEKFGFQKVAHFAEVGFKFGRWIDVGYWQRRLGAGAPD